MFAAFLNTVIDAPNNPADANFNEMESIYEWVTEDLMNIENAVPEQEGTDQDQQVQKKPVDWISLSYTSLQQEQFCKGLHPFSAIESLYFNPVFDIHTPPPEDIA